ncbi:hypothetical protein [Aliarcobacter skirrowii]|uniref:hypothetical protein n=1 Tax=Aliarcobacter skirrowii TaxID=28200 RepID=UPI0029AD37DC|nr:hypothetical protein [Aliarcobacter skirrowii]MDX4028356.1 hypothetical protein [Aliarcobacter skirrowii]
MQNLTYSYFNELAFEFIKNHQVYFLIVTAAIIGKIKESSKQNIFTVWIVYLFGTFFHELSHYVAALITNGKPKMASLFPKKVNDSYVLGYVQTHNLKWYNVFFIALAPFTLLILSFYVYLHFFDYVEESLLSYLVYIFMIISLVFSSLPSKTDFSLVFSSKYPFIFNFITPIILFIGCYLYFK